MLTKKQKRINWILVAVLLVLSIFFLFPVRKKEMRKAGQDVQKRKNNSRKACKSPFGKVNFSSDSSAKTTRMKHCE